MTRVGSVLRQAPEARALAQQPSLLPQRKVNFRFQNMSGNQYFLISAFFISAMVIAEPVQVGTIFGRCNDFIMAVGKLASDKSVIAVALAHVEVTIN